MLWLVFRAGDGIRTREYQLGGLMPYHLATPAFLRHDFTLPTPIGQVTYTICSLLGLLSNRPGRCLTCGAFSGDRSPFEHYCSRYWAD